MEASYSPLFPPLPGLLGEWRRLPLPPTWSLVDCPIRDRTLHHSRRSQRAGQPSQASRLDHAHLLPPSLNQPQRLQPVTMEVALKSLSLVVELDVGVPTSKEEGEGERCKELEGAAKVGVRARGEPVGLKREARVSRVVEWGEEVAD